MNFNRALSRGEKTTFTNNLSNKRKDEIHLICEEYKKTYGSDIKDDILEKYKKVHFCYLIVALFCKDIENDIFQINKAIKGFVKDEDTPIEILSTWPLPFINKIKERYSTIFPGKSLINDIEQNTSGYLKKLLLSLLTNVKWTSPIADLKECKKLARLLYLAGEKRIFGCDKKVFTEIFTLRNETKIILMSKKYKSLTLHTIFQVIERKTNFYAGKCLKAIFEGMYLRNPFFEKKFTIL